MSCVSCAEAQAAEHFGARQSSYCIALAKGQIRQLPGSSSASEAGEEEGSACVGAGCGKLAYVPPLRGFVTSPCAWQYASRLDVWCVECDSQYMVDLQPYSYEALSLTGR